MDEAGDMLNQAPSLQDIVDEIQAEKLTEVMKRKEWERSEKWRKMAKVVRKGSEGQGMEFEFDSKNPKLIERTWKGIPDRWRGAAWWSFMATSAREHQDSTAEDRIVAEFHRLQLRSSPDDVQIDLDVPRTISRHIMFRRRYRGGQRLLFRVLHAISIYFPETGYVQGMASLAATLLCYFDEEKCFVMLVRMWQLRGLARLYRPGFEELMAAMSDFSTNWLNKEVASKLVSRVYCSLMTPLAGANDFRSSSASIPRHTVRAGTLLYLTFPSLSQRSCEYGMSFSYWATTRLHQATRRRPESPEPILPHQVNTMSCMLQVRHWLKPCGRFC